MPIYQYRGKDSQGRPVTGQLVSQDQNAAARVLQRQGVLLLGLEEQQAARTVNREPAGDLFRRRIKMDERILLTRQLFALTRSGVPIIRALNGLAESTNNPELKRILGEMARVLTAGGDLTTAFRQHPKVFSPIYISMIQVGETTGRLPEALQALIHHLEMERETIKRVSTAMRYPTLVLVSMAIALTVITLFVIPSFVPVFKSMHTELPLPTRILIGVSDFAVNHGLMIGIALLVLGFAIYRYIKTPEGGLGWDQLKLRLPVFGSLFKRIALSRFSRSLAMMMSSGVPILRCLNVVSDSVGNRYIGAAIRRMQSGVERGERLTATAAATGMFTPLVLQMMAVGEETGSIDDLMNDVADFYEEEVDYELKFLADAIEPIMLGMMAFMVLILALGVFLPIWELGASAGGR
ncbi:type II secretion system F family protein [Oceanobacter mangrovi]|uniref:type II secretion system F family protein n=1 Tax=Oceanobacter mangrovi TaxID=2862510 RepID=UPI001C8D6739|nr:type II secretion system F family protein [Oceanobacter mangrovi]